MKTKSITSRILAVIITVLLLASLIPATSVFAAKDKFKDTLLSSAEVSGLTAPKIGADVDTSGNVPSGSKYSIVKVNWFDMSGVITKVTSFEAGKPYRVSVEVKANDGCKFQTGATFKINGNTATETNANSDRTQITFIFTYPALGDGVIKSVKITDITAPKIGADVDTKGSVPSGSNYSIVKVNWFDASGVLTKATSFEEGKPYRVSVEVKPNKGYSFDKNTAYTINGKTATVTHTGTVDNTVVFILNYDALKKEAAETSSKKAETSSKTSSKAESTSKPTEETSEVVEETVSEEIVETESIAPSTITSNEGTTGNNGLDSNLVILIIAIAVILCITAIVIVLLLKKKK